MNLKEMKKKRFEKTFILKIKKKKKKITAKKTSINNDVFDIKIYLYNNIL